jgi:hypothetical protein
MRGRIVAGAVGLGCAGLMLLVVATPVEAGDRGGKGRMASGELAAECERAKMQAPPDGPDLKITTDVPDGATVAPGQVIGVRLTWDPKAWSGEDLDMALACVRVKGGLDPDLSAVERPTANDGVFEYRLRVPESIRPDCDICVEGFLAGMSPDNCCPQVAGSDRRCFMSGPPAPRPPAEPTMPEPPAAPPTTPTPAPPTTPTPAVQVPPRAPAEVPAQVAGENVARPAPAPAPAPPPEVAPVAELPRTGPEATRLGTAGAGLSLALGGLAVIGGAGRRTRRRIAT